MKREKQKESGSRQPAVGSPRPELREGQSAETTEALLTQDEIAARLKTSVRNVIRLQKDGVLPFIELGKAVRFYWPTVISHLIEHFTVCRVAAPPAIVPHWPSTNLHGQQTNKQTGVQGTARPT